MNIFCIAMIIFVVLEGVVISRFLVLEAVVISLFLV
jgi:hypothetical protein